MFNMFFSAGMPPITNKALELLGAEQGAFIWVAGDGHVISLTERANALTGMHPMQSIYEILSERATVTLRLCFSEQTEQTIDEVLDDVMYHLTISTMGEESALLLFRERLQKSALHDLTDLQIRSALGVIRMVSDTMKTIPERQNRERCMAQMEKACMRIERAVGHAE